EDVPAGLVAAVAQGAPRASLGLPAGQGQAQHGAGHHGDPFHRDSFHWVVPGPYAETGRRPCISRPPNPIPSTRRVPRDAALSRSHAPHPAPLGSAERPLKYEENVNSALVENLPDPSV